MDSQKVIRSDKGAETILMAECQLQLRRREKPGLGFRKAYIYGPSNRNVRIESWWGLLTDGQTEQWKQYFGKLESDRFFDGSFYDITALQFLYMPIIREHIASFVEVHNAHTIRK